MEKKVEQRVEKGLEESLLRLPAVMKCTGLSRSSVYLQVSRGLLPSPIQLGARIVAWPASEIQAVIAARIAGSSDSDIGIIVMNLEADRSGTHGFVRADRAPHLREKKPAVCFKCGDELDPEPPF